MNVAIFSRKIQKQHAEFVKSFFQKLENIGWNPIIEEECYRKLKKVITIKENYPTFNSFRDFLSGIDLFISLGGDGTFLKSVTYIRSSGVPIMGINTGRLGFLSNTNIADFEVAIEKIIHEEYTFQKRSLIQIQTEENTFGEQNFALNELTVHKMDTASMITIEAYINNKYVNTYWADGLLVGTPTGSTAYNLSCGGPIIAPESEVFFLTPIAAHNLNVRPMIVPDHLPITLKGVGRDKKFLLTLDSTSKPVKNGTEIRLQKSDFSIRIIKFSDIEFFDTIRKKMFWGIDQRN